MDVNKRQNLLTIWMHLCVDRNVSPLFHFCKRGNLWSVRLLFFIGADCTELFLEGNLFPMFAAAQLGHLEICK